MSQRMGQIQGRYAKTRNLFNVIKSEHPKLKQIVKLGVQLKPGFGFKIDNNKYDVGKTGILQLDNMELSSCNFTLYHNNRKDDDGNDLEEEIKVIPAIVDFVYEDE